jgi:hypothetical protein
MAISAASAGALARLASATHHTWSLLELTYRVKVSGCMDFNDKRVQMLGQIGGTTCSKPRQQEQHCCDTYDK